MVGDGGGRGGVGRALAVVRVGAGSLIYRQIKSLHCSELLVTSSDRDIAIYLTKDN